jgi:hypothetical protein
MFLLSVLFSVITLNPAITGQPVALAGEISAPAISPDANCGPGKICASARLPINRNGCHVNNVWNSSKGGTPLTIDVTETGGNGSAVYVYWVNATDKTIAITGKAHANYYCPR